MESIPQVPRFVPVCRDRADLAGRRIRDADPGHQKFSLLNGNFAGLFEECLPVPEMDDRPIGPGDDRVQSVEVEDRFKGSSLLNRVSG